MSPRGQTPRQDDAISDLETHVGFWLRFVSNHVSSAFGRLIEEQGLTVSEWVALRRLLSTGASTTSTLVDALGMTKGAVTKVIDRLVAKHLVVRSLDPEDGRVQRVSLTRAGRALVPKLAALADQNDAHFFGHLSAKERDALIDTLREVIRRHGLTRVPTE